MLQRVYGLGMDLTKEPQTDVDLASWDWLAELRRQERRIPWLARQTGVAQNTVYRYASGRNQTPISWLREAATVLGRGVRS